MDRGPTLKGPDPSPIPQPRPLSRLLLRRFGGGRCRSGRLGGALLGGLLVVLLGSRLRIGSSGGIRLRRVSVGLLGSERHLGDREGEGKQCCFHFFYLLAGLASIARSQSHLEGIAPKAISPPQAIARPELGGMAVKIYLGKSSSP